MSDRAARLKDVLWFAALSGAVAAGFRLWFGLGATTNLTDQIPWGLWKILNVVAGAALSTGAFSVGLLVYVLRREELKPLVKPALLVAFLGDASSCFALMLDIGLPYRIWHPILMWNARSFLFQAAWCVMLYLTVTMVELSPTVLERLRLGRAAHLLHRSAFAVVVFGMSLSALHHFSLGSLFLVTPTRLHPLWFTPRLPLLFVVSAMGAGMMVVVLVRLLHARLEAPRAPAPAPFQQAGSGARAEENGASSPGSIVPESDLRMLSRLSSIAAAVLASYLVLKALDLWATGAVPALLTPGFESYLYLGEYAIFAAAIAVVAVERARRSVGGLAAAAALACAGLVWNRLNVGIFGYFRDAGTIYIPSLSEWTISLGVIAAAGLAFLYASEKLPIFGDSPPEPRLRPVLVPVTGDGRRAMAPAVPNGISRTTLVAVAAIPLAWTALYPPYQAPAREPAAATYAPIAANAVRSVLAIDGNRIDAAVLFPHRNHQERLGKTACATCHHLSMPRDHSTPCSRCHRSMEATTDLFEHGLHLEWVASRDGLHGATRTNRTCSRCHLPGQPKTAGATVPCLECHRRDMRPAPSVPERLQAAASYRAAMHQTCLRCHRREAERLKRPALGDCSNCHPDGAARGARPGRVAGPTPTAAGTRM